MIRFDNLPPEVMQALCTPMHIVLPASNPYSHSRTGSGPLYIGSLSAIHDSELLRSHSITHLVQVLDIGWLPESGGNSQLSRSPVQLQSPNTQFFATASATSSIQSVNGLTCYRIDLSDQPNADLQSHLESVCTWINSSLANGKGVLVHCQQGISRSAAVVIAYLIRYKGMGYDDAYEYVRKTRACIKPNQGFIRALREWEALTRSNERRPGMGRRFTT